MEPEVWETARIWEIKVLSSSGGCIAVLLDMAMYARNIEVEREYDDDGKNESDGYISES